MNALEIKYGTIPLGQTPVDPMAIVFLLFLTPLSASFSYKNIISPFVPTFFCSRIGEDYY